MFEETTKERKEQLNNEIDDLLNIIWKANYKWVKKQFNKNKQLEVRFPFSEYAKIDKKILESVIKIYDELDSDKTYQKQSLLGREHAIDWIRIRVVTNLERERLEIWIQCEIEEVKNLIINRVEEQYGALSRKLTFWTVSKIELSKIYIEKNYIIL